MTLQGIKRMLALSIAGALAAAAIAGAQEPVESPPPPVEVTAKRAIEELIDINAKLAAENQRLVAENQRLAAEVARVKLDAARIEKQRDELQNFIRDHEEYAENYEQYTFFREKAEREERARQAAEAQARREAEKLRQQQEREERLRQRSGAASEEDTVLAKRIDVLRRAGYTRVGDRVFVGEMGYSYRTETREEIRYSPLIDFWYVDRDEEILYNEMTVSGSVIHAGTEERNLSVALAFYDATGAQIGTTTVRVDGAKPGTPYPFTSVVTMAANRPFKRYSAWVLYDDPTSPPPDVPPAEAQPMQPNSPPPADG